MLRNARKGSRMDVLVVQELHIPPHEYRYVKVRFTPQAGIHMRSLSSLLRIDAPATSCDFAAYNCHRVQQVGDSSSPRLAASQGLQRYSAIFEATVPEGKADSTCTPPCSAHAYAHADSTREQVGGLEDKPPEVREARLNNGSPTVRNATQPHPAGLSVCRTQDAWRRHCAEHFHDWPHTLWGRWWAVPRNQLSYKSRGTLWNIQHCNARPLRYDFGKLRIGKTQVVEFSLANQGVIPATARCEAWWTGKRCFWNPSGAAASCPQQSKWPEDLTPNPHFTVSCARSIPLEPKATWPGEGARGLFLVSLL